MNIEIDMIDVSGLELDHVLGQGATAVVYKSKLHGKSCAAKVFRTEGLDSKRASSEMQAMMQFDSHPNVVQYLGASVSKNGSPIILVELVDGRDLERHLSYQKPGFDLGKQTIHRWSLDILSALDFLHDRDPILIHCDVKPANLIVSSCLSSLKLTDFGIAKTLKRDRRLVESHAANEGSPRYRAPEVLSSSDKAHYTEKVDVYSAALVIFFLLTGRRPENDVKVDPRWRPLTVNARWRWRALSDLLERMWAHDPAQRPSAGECAAHLRALPVADAERSARSMGCYVGFGLWRRSRQLVVS
jgi:serine/threonine protein kinase